jgi:hypothetical protein
MAPSYANPKKNHFKANLPYFFTPINDVDQFFSSSPHVTMLFYESPPINICEDLTQKDLKKRKLYGKVKKIKMFKLPNYRGLSL